MTVGELSAKDIDKFVEIETGFLPGTIKGVLVYVKHFQDNHTTVKLVPNYLEVTVKSDREILRGPV